AAHPILGVQHEMPVRREQLGSLDGRKVPLRVSFAGECPGPLATIRLEPASPWECHDHLPFRGSQSGCVLGPPSQRGDLDAVAGASSKRLGWTARPVADWRPSYT